MMAGPVRGSLALQSNFAEGCGAVPKCGRGVRKCGGPRLS